jgi:hypothetical protein
MSTNAIGLKPEESKDLKERTMKSHEQPIISALKEVFHLTFFMLSILILTLLL